MWTKIKSFAAIAGIVVIAGLCLISWMLYRANVKKAIVIAAQGKAIVGYQLNERKYAAYMEADHAASQQVQKVVGGTVSNTAATLNQLFGGDAVPATGTPPKSPGKTSP